MIRWSFLVENEGRVERDMVNERNHTTATFLLACLCRHCSIRYGLHSIRRGNWALGIYGIPCLFWLAYIYIFFFCENLRGLSLLRTSTYETLLSISLLVSKMLPGVGVACVTCTCTTYLPNHLPALYPRRGEEMQRIRWFHFSETRHFYSWDISYLVRMWVPYSR